ncbi:MAG: AzlD domain-containing protein [Pseudomonadota bacterium]
MIGILAVAAFSIRILGLVAGGRIRASRYAWVLDELPGLIVLSLVASSLAGQPTQVWFAAIVAVCVALLTNHLISTMIVGVVAFAAITAFLV